MPFNISSHPDLFPDCVFITKWLHKSSFQAITEHSPFVWLISHLLWTQLYHIESGMIKEKSYQKLTYAHHKCSHYPTYSAMELSDVKNWINSKLISICMWDKTREEMVIENLYFPAHFHFNHKKSTKHSKNCHFCSLWVLTRKKSKVHTMKFKDSYNLSPTL